MNKAKSYLWRLIIPRLLSRLCFQSNQDRIQTSGPDATKNNCFLVEIRKDQQPYMVVLQFSNDSLQGPIWDGTTYSGSHVMELTSVDDRDLFVVHYLRTLKVTCQGLTDFITTQVTRWPYLQDAYQKLQVRSFRWKRLVAVQRAELLKLMESRAAEDRPSFTVHEMMNHFYSPNWIFHPGSSILYERMEMHLQWLLETKMLTRKNDRYLLTGHALSELTIQQTDERRHQENLQMQRRMWWLTIAIMFLAIVQSGIIKLPTLLDLSTYQLCWPW